MSISSPVRRLTDDEPPLVETLVRRVVPRERQGTLDPFARSFLGELHLEDGFPDRQARDLVGEFVELSRRDLELGRRVFMLRGVRV